MYGYDIPVYAREYLRSWRSNDRFLRLRWSVDFPGLFLLERKTRYTEFPDAVLGTDRAIQYKDGFRPVLYFKPREIKDIAQHLARTDVQRLGGAKALAQQLELQDEADRERSDRDARTECDAISGEAYDWLAWREGRKVAVGGRVS